MPSPQSMPSARLGLVGRPCLHSPGFLAHGRRDEHNPEMSKHKFIDLFAGCGGFSLGLSLAGLEGQFAIEHDAMAFKTFAANFLGDRDVPIQRFAWPRWLERQAWSIDELLDTQHAHLADLAGKIDVLAGGPPCQGFSFAGKRQASDPRNQLFEKYVQVVDAIKPRALVLENVPGMGVAHSIHDGPSKGRGKARESYFDKLCQKLDGTGYDVFGDVVDASRFGVPQRRSRLIVLGLDKQLAARLRGGIKRVFELLEEQRVAQLRDLGLGEAITAQEAISDLEADRAEKQSCMDPDSPRGFNEVVYREPRTPYQQLMHGDCDAATMDSMRLARHSPTVRARFAAIQDGCRLGVLMDKASRDRHGLRKHRIHPMAPDQPAPTITTLPDDILHYAEPRILTVRESARLQSFPDWFRFQGNFTTGGERRTKECPRYTQVGNAVPPYLGRAIGLAIIAALDEATRFTGPVRPLDTPRPGQLEFELE